MIIVFQSSVQSSFTSTLRFLRLPDAGVARLLCCFWLVVTRPAFRLLSAARSSYPGRGSSQRQMASTYSTMTLSIQVRGWGSSTAPSKKPMWPPCWVRTNITLGIFSADRSSHFTVETQLTADLSAAFTCWRTGSFWNKTISDTSSLFFLRFVTFSSSKKLFSFLIVGKKMGKNIHIIF